MFDAMLDLSNAGRGGEFQIREYLTDRFYVTVELPGEVVDCSAEELVLLILSR